MDGWGSKIEFPFVRLQASLENRYELVSRGQSLAELFPGLFASRRP